MNPGRIQVWITRPSPTVNQQAMEALTSEFPENIQGRPVDFLHANYSFADLTVWEDKLIDLLNRDGVNAMGVSQRANKLRIGVDDEDALSPVIEEEAQAQGIPLDAIVIDEISTVRPSLQDSHRPLVGGLKITWSTSTFGGEKGPCSLGFIAEIDGMDGFITAAHCSETQGSVDGSNYYQPNRGILPWTNFVGTERIDHAFGHQGHPWCPSGRRCRFADVNFVEEDPEISTALGRVAKPPLYRNNWNGTSTWRVTGNYEPWVGDAVEKIGIATGWTYGYVLEDCIHHNIDNTDITFMCQHIASYNHAEGDSGGPILYWIGWDGASSDVAYSGVHSGWTIWDGEVESVYSSQSDIAWEFIDEEGVSEFHLCHPNHQSWQYC